MDEIEIKPRIKPQDINDIMVGCFITPYILFWQGTFVILPSLYIGSLLCNDQHLKYIFGLSIAIPLLLLTLLFTVKSIKISENGIRFVRYLGWPKYIKWSDIKRVVKNVPRKELIVKGWVWPVYPFAKEMTASLTSIGYYKIEWTDDYCYFPPATPSKFEDVVQKYNRIESADE